MRLFSDAEVTNRQSIFMYPKLNINLGWWWKTINIIFFGDVWISLYVVACIFFAVVVVWYEILNIGGFLEKVHNLSSYFKCSMLWWLFRWNYIIVIRGWLLLFKVQCFNLSCSYWCVVECNKNNTMQLRWFDPCKILLMVHIGRTYFLRGLSLKVHPLKFITIVGILIVLTIKWN